MLFRNFFLIFPVAELQYVMNKNKTIKSGSIAEIAAASGVSTATVSRVFSRHPYVSEAVRQRVLQAAKAMNYAPAISSSRYIFGLLSNSGDGYCFGAYDQEILFYTSKYLFEAGFNVQIFNVKQLPYLHRNTFRGVVLLGAVYAEPFRKLRIPAVLVNDFAEGMHSVVTDHRESLALAVDYLWRHGHRRIAYLRSDNATWGSVQRELGYRETLQQHGAVFDPALLGPYEPTLESVTREIARLLKGRPTALVVEGENIAMMVHAALTRQGIRVPQDLSLITFENSAVSPYMTPPWTTVRQDFAALGELAAATVIALSKPRGREEIPQLATLHNTLIERESVLTLGGK